MRIAGAHAVVTGGGTGIGAAIAQALASKGARVSLLGRRREPLDAVAGALGEAAFVVPCDVTDPQAVADAMAAARGRHGRIDILVNNAGAAATVKFARLDFETWRSAMAVNCDAVFHCTRAVIDEMLRAGTGRIVTIASVAGLRGVAYASAYSAAKHAAVGLMRSIALETKGTDVTVNSVCPGFVDTDIVAEAVRTISAKTARNEREARDELAHMNPSGRIIAPEEVAATVVQLIQSTRNGEAVEIA
ncbi:MAG TPA: SDR family oxidoreductase [Qipengyuania sp.]|nr:SDR family oxidoreductase [Qipengyuania sp.]